VPVVHPEGTRGDDQGWERNEGKPSRWGSWNFKIENQKKKKPLSGIQTRGGDGGGNRNRGAGVWTEGLHLEKGERRTVGQNGQCGR